MADPYTTPIPGASSYEAASLAATTAYENALARLNQQRQDTLRQYGYAGDINPTTGVVQNVRVDANLPYGAYQQARQSHADAFQAARDAALERGLGHGGLAQSIQNRIHQGFGAEDAQMGTALTQALGGYQDQQNQAAYSRDAALADAQLQAARDAIQQQMFNPANLDGLTVPNGPDWESIIKQLLGGDNGGGDGGTPTYEQQLIGRGFTQKQVQGLDPGIGAAILSKPPASDGRVSPSGWTLSKPKPASQPASPRYETYKKDVRLKPGQTVHFKPGKGYYAA